MKSSIRIALCALLLFSCKTHHQVEDQSSEAQSPFSNVEGLQLVDQELLQKIFESSKVETRYAESFHKQSIAYKELSNGVTIWEQAAGDNGRKAYIVSARDQNGGLKYYVFEKDIPLNSLAGESARKGFPDKFIIDKLSEIEPTIHTKIPEYERVGLIFDPSHKIAMDSSKEFHVILRDSDLSHIQRSYLDPSYKMPDNLTHILSDFNQVIAFNPNLYFAPEGHGFRGNTTFTTNDRAKTFPLAYLVDAVSSFLSPMNVEHLESVHVELRTCQGGACNIETQSIKKGAMLETLLNEFLQNENFKNLKKLSGMGASLSISGGNMNTVNTVSYDSKMDTFRGSQASAESVIGSHVKIEKIANELQYSILNMNDSKLSPHDPLLFEMIDQRVALAGRIREFGPVGTKEEILKVFKEGSDDLKLRSLAQFINLELTIRQYHDGKLTSEQVHTRILELKKDGLVISEQAPETAFKEWKENPPLATIKDAVRKVNPENVIALDTVVKARRTRITPLPVVKPQVDTTPEVKLKFKK